MTDDPQPPPRPPERLDAANLRARARRSVAWRLLLGTVFMVGALSHAFGPQPRARAAAFWMTALLALSTLNVGLGLRKLALVRRRGLRLWPYLTIGWGVVGVVLLKLLLDFRP